MTNPYFYEINELSLEKYIEYYLIYLQMTLHLKEIDVHKIT